MPETTTKAGHGPDRVHEIHAIALAEVLAGGSGFYSWPLYGELKGLKSRPVSAEWLEATIMACVIGRIRPSQTVANLNALRSLRNERGEAEAFTRFKTRIEAYLAPDILTNHAYKSRNFSTLDHQEIWSHVGGLIDGLQGAGFEVFLNSGTLLGVVRDGRLIEHDDDIDLAVVVPAETEAEAAQGWKTLLTDFEARGLLDPEGRKQPGIAKLRPIGETEIDLFPAWVADGRMFVYPHTYGQLAREEVLPTRPCPITGHGIPAEPEKMLALNYGEGWRTPDPLFKFPWTAANKTFARFLDRL